MRKIISKTWGFICVPFVLLCGGLMFSAVLSIYSHSSTYFGLPTRFVLAFALCMLGMFLLRKMPRHTLIGSSAVVCVVSLAYYLLLIYRFWFGGIENHSVLTAQKILGAFTTLPNNIILPFTTLFDAESSFVRAIIFSVIEILFPMVFAFSGVFNRITALFVKKRERDMTAKWYRRTLFQLTNYLQYTILFMN